MSFIAFLFDMLLVAKPRRRRRFQKGLFLGVAVVGLLLLTAPAQATHVVAVRHVVAVPVHAVLVTPFISTVQVHAYAYPVAPVAVQLQAPAVPSYAAPAPVQTLAPVAVPAPVAAPLAIPAPVAVPLTVPAPCLGYGAIGYGASVGVLASPFVSFDSVFVNTRLVRVRVNNRAVLVRGRR